jgi:hypothetical protein
MYSIEGKDQERKKERKKERKIIIYLESLAIDIGDGG